MSESLLTCFIKNKKTKNKKKSQRGRKIIHFPLVSHNALKWKCGFVIFIGCVRNCAVALGFHAVCLPNLQDHQLRTVLKINQSSCDIQCELMEADSWWWHNWHMWTRFLTDLKAFGFSPKPSHQRQKLKSLPRLQTRKDKNRHLPEKNKASNLPSVWIYYCKYLYY